jgi:hypothetical protein
VTPLPLRLALGQAPLRAQLSPNCLRNGGAAACAVTPGESGPERSVVTVMFADHSAWRLEKDERRCRAATPAPGTRAATATTGARQGSESNTCLWIDSFE